MGRVGRLQPPLQEGEAQIWDGQLLGHGVGMEGMNIPVCEAGN